MYADEFFVIGSDPYIGSPGEKQLLGVQSSRQDKLPELCTISYTCDSSPQEESVEKSEKFPIVHLIHRVTSTAMKLGLP